jgi:hypothetical protein
LEPSTHELGEIMGIKALRELGPEIWVGGTGRLCLFLVLEQPKQNYRGQRRQERGRNGKGGWMPKKMRLTKVAMPVASATGKDVRAPNSGISNSIANITPPIGVLKVAAMPAPAPAGTSVIRCYGAM